MKINIGKTFMADAKTVDNLGPEVHQKFINDTSLLSEEEVKKIFQTPNIAKRAEILKTAPKYSEIDILWGLQQRETTPFDEPPNFVLTAGIFTYPIIPSLGSGSKIIEKLKSLKKEEEKEEDSDVARQRKSLLKFATVMSELNKILSLIKRKKDEYHKG